LCSIGKQPIRSKVLGLARYILPWFIAVSAVCYLVFSRPYNIELEKDYTCEIARDPGKVATFIRDRYGSDGDLSKITWALYRHGFYLRNFHDETYVFISTHQGSPCLLRALAVDTAKIIVRTDANGKVLTMERN